MVYSKRFTLRAPTPFELRTVVCSHGWYGLPPFAWDKTAGEFSMSYRENTIGPVTVTVRQVGDALRATARSHSAIDGDGAARVRECVRRCLRLDEDLAEFYDRVRADPRIGWVCERGAGRILRSPSLFDDLLKILCTTNCSWALTRAMVQKLVDELGEVAPGGKTFPTAAALAGRAPRFFRDVVRAGYRADHMAALGRAVHRGELDPDGWPAVVDTAELRKQILALPGIGPYAAAHLLRLAGHYDDPGIDSWCRTRFRDIYGMRRPPADRTIVRRYRKFGRYLGLALWMDLTREWHVEPPDR